MRNVLVALGCIVTLSGLAAAQQPSGSSCEGDYAIVRHSQIKPTSSYEAFIKAQEAHIAWYRKNGFNDNMIYSSRFAMIDPQTKTVRYSNTDVLAFHVRPPGGDQNPEGYTKDKVTWDAYIKMYMDSSDIKAEYRVCLPKNR